MKTIGININIVNQQTGVSIECISILFAQKFRIQKLNANTARDIKNII
jgi:hypothetical protein